MSDRFLFLRSGLLLLAGLVSSLVWAAEGLVEHPPHLSLDPGLMWLPVERDPNLKVDPKPEGATLKGRASYYGIARKFHGRSTASGDRFDPAAFTGASNRFPLGTWIAVRRPGTHHCVVVRVNDRMHPKHKTRVVDLSVSAARSLSMISAGVVEVEVRKLAGPPGVETAICLEAFKTLPDVEVPAGMAADLAP